MISVVLARVTATYSRFHSSAGILPGQQEAHKISEEKVGKRNQKREHVTHLVRIPCTCASCGVKLEPWWSHQWSSHFQTPDLWLCGPSPIWSLEISFSILSSNLTAELIFIFQLCSRWLFHEGYYIPALLKSLTEHLSRHFTSSGIRHPYFSTMQTLASSSLSSVFLMYFFSAKKGFSLFLANKRIMQSLMPKCTTQCKRQILRPN